MRKLILTAAVSLAAASLATAAPIAQWNFNGDSATTVPGGNLAPTPSLGVGTASILGGISTSFASGTANGGSSDPVNTTPPNYGWQTTTYPAQGAGSGTAGVRFDVPTTGVTGPDLFVYFDTRHSNTSSRFVQVEYTTDGTNFISAPDGVFEGPAGDTWFKQRQVNLSADPLVFNNPNFGFRVVTIFDPANPGSYTASNSGSNYAGSGTLRFDMVTVDTAPIPEPATLGLLAAGSLLALRRRS
jgi:hypothetical protein